MLCYIVLSHSFAMCYMFVVCMYQLESLSVCVDSGEHQYYMFTRWGRVGSRGMSALSCLGVGGLSAAKEAFSNKFMDKTGNAWRGGAGPFIPQQGKYTLMDMTHPEQAHDDDHAISEQKEKEPAHSVDIASLLSPLFLRMQSIAADSGVAHSNHVDVSMFHDTLTHFEQDVKKFIAHKKHETEMEVNQPHQHDVAPQSDIKGEAETIPQAHQQQQVIQEVNAQPKPAPRGLGSFIQGILPSFFPHPQGSGAVCMDPSPVLPEHEQHEPSPPEEEVEVVSADPVSISVVEPLYGDDQQQQDFIGAEQKQEQQQVEVNQQVVDEAKDGPEVVVEPPQMEAPASSPSPISSVLSQQGHAFDQLHEMGFVDDRLNERLLQNNKWDVTATLDWLLANQAVGGELERQM